ncbi:3,4-dihydroxy-2-butanone-4-phosphate synthase [Acetobacteraceae bacterium KSS8]|uniref:Multifunctional fusion protein n=1 Tax=Endosaccharibacter trunci TaxID=2812733 RepID=A0ABT1W762_9PROT|nr:3,4-dihydroxy-2-butanone-4-phosphate synthase [Acetobacteraceae bacterium KSS8]
MTDYPDRIAAAIQALREGRMVIMTDDEGRENEGDVVMAAQHVTADAINFMVTHCRGLVCLAMEPEQVDRLGLPPMVRDNRAPRSTAFTVSIEAATGVETGISARDRARTIAVAASPDAVPADLVSPGHVFPLRCVPGGVLERDGHTEGSVDLLKLAGLRPSAVICEIMSADGSMARMAELEEFGARHDLPIVTIAELVAYLRDRETGSPMVRRGATTTLPVANSDTIFEMRAYIDRNGGEHLALIKGNPSASGTLPLVRLHSECVTGDVFGSLRCDCGTQLQAAARRIAESDNGILLYLRGHEGRGIGLANKVRAYALQDEGLDTVEANHRLGFAADARDYSVAAAILRDCGVERLALLTNNPAKIAALEGHGITVAERVPLEMPQTAHNDRYMRTKRDRMGHVLASIGDEAAE